MTYHLSNLQLNALRHIVQQGGTLPESEFVKLDQRITSGLGRRKEPLLARTGKQAYSVTAAGMEVMAAMESTDVFRKMASLSVAKCFSTMHRRTLFAIATRRGRKKSAA